MYENNMIYGLDLDLFSADEIAEKVGVSKFQKDQLLEAFREARHNIDFSWVHGNNNDRDKAHLESAPVTYEVYKRFYGSGKEPLAITRLVKKLNCLPSSMQFWIDPVASSTLHEIVIEDGHYTSKSSKEPFYKRG